MTASKKTNFERIEELARENEGLKIAVRNRLAANWAAVIQTVSRCLCVAACFTAGAYFLGGRVTKLDANIDAQIDAKWGRGASSQSVKPDRVKDTPPTLEKKSSESEISVPGLPPPTAEIRSATDAGLQDALAPGGITQSIYSFVLTIVTFWLLRRNRNLRKSLISRYSAYLAADETLIDPERESSQLDRGGDTNVKDRL